MAVNSKKRKRKAKREEQRKLNKQVALLPENGEIPSSVATAPTLPDTLSYLDGRNYQLIFERYNHEECEIPQLDKTTAKALINKLNEITRVNNSSISSTHLLRHKVINQNDYSSLFSKLEDDVELYEVKYANTGRIMCYFINEHPHEDETKSNYCCIIAVLIRHRAT
jgi:hypothetical protein